MGQVLLHSSDTMYITARMNRRQFISGVAGTSLIGVAGCTGGVPTGFLHGFLSSGVVENQIVDKLKQTEYKFKENNVYINESLRAIQLRGKHNVLDSLVQELPIEEYSLHKTTEYLPITASPVFGSRSQPQVRSTTDEKVSGLQELQNRSNYGESVSVGLIDTSARWDSWYETEENMSVNKQDFSNTATSLLDPLRNQNHGELTARTLFDSTTGLSTKATPYHAKISELETTPQFFISLCESLDWLSKHNVPVIVIPLSIVDESEDVLSVILNHYTSTVNQSIILVASGNVNPCSGDSNALLTESNQYVIGVGSYTPENDSVAMRSGEVNTTELLGPDTHRISDDRIFSGTSSASAYIGGACALLWSNIIQQDPTISRSAAQTIVYNKLTTMPRIQDPCTEVNSLPFLDIEKLLQSL